MELVCNAVVAVDDAEGVTACEWLDYPRVAVVGAWETCDGYCDDAQNLNVLHHVRPGKK